MVSADREVWVTGDDESWSGESERIVGCSKPYDSEAAGRMQKGELGLAIASSETIA